MAIARRALARGAAWGGGNARLFSSSSRSDYAGNTSYTPSKPRVGTLEAMDGNTVRTQLGLPSPLNL